MFEANGTFESYIIEQYGRLAWNGFRKKYKEIDPSMKTSMEEWFREGVGEGPAARSPAGLGLLIGGPTRLGLKVYGLNADPWFRALKRDCFNSGTCQSSKGRSFDYLERKFNPIGINIIYII